MEKGKHKECYGTMFPDALHFRENNADLMSARCFTYQLE